MALAQTGARVAVVEGDLRRPKVSEYLGVEGGAGLTDVLIGKVELDDVLQRWGRTELYVLPAGRIPPNPSELLGSDAFNTMLEELKESFEFVIVDAPPVLAVTDAAVLSKSSTGLLMVVAATSTTKQSFEDALDVMNTAGADIVGIIVTMLPASGPDSHGYYGYHSEPSSENTQSARDKSRARSTGKSGK